LEYDDKRRVRGQVRLLLLREQQQQEEEGVAAESEK
jgi:hypothetical protein